MLRDVSKFLKRFHSERDPQAMEAKWKAMNAHPFAFFRGTSALYYATLPQADTVASTPAAWVCGDLHLENFGAFHDGRGSVQFDINDFDEACLAPCGLDVLRLLTSLYLADALHTGRGLESKAASQELAHTMLVAYADQLAKGKSSSNPLTSHRSVIRETIERVRSTSPEVVVASRVEKTKRGIRLKVDGDKVADASSREKDMIGELLIRSAWLHTASLHDVAKRYAGLASLGLRRYEVLVETRGAKGSLKLLDIKESIPSRCEAISSHSQPRWSSDAQRIACIQHLALVAAPSFLEPLRRKQRSYVLRELQPSKDRIELGTMDSDARRWQQAVRTMGELTACAHLRGQGRSGSASVKRFIEFGRDASWRKPMLDLAAEVAMQTRQQWKEYAEAYKDGYFSA